MKQFKFVDFFAGGGGASTGIMQAGHQVVVAINHNPGALEAHAKNHPETIHLNEDVREVDPYKLKNEFHTDAAWISAECTHFSGAKGGTSREADSRQLSEVFVHYARICQWGIIFVENVREFLKWGPIVPRRITKAKRGQAEYERRYCRVQVELMEAVCNADHEAETRLRSEMDSLAIGFAQWDNYDKQGNGFVFVPDQATAGSMYTKWLRHFDEMGYDYDYRLLNSADFGAPQSRLRYFGVFIKRGSGISFKWPRQTHAKIVSQDGFLLNGLLPHVPCRTILDLDSPGPSIFTRKKALVEASLARIRTGLDKYAGNGDVVMVDRYHSGSVPVSVDSPMPTVMATLEKSLIRVTTVDHYTHNAPPQEINEPLGTAMAKRDKYLSSCFLVPTDYSNQPIHVNQPINTVLASNRHTYLCKAQFIAKDYSGGNKPGGQTSPIDAPLGTIMTGNRHNYVTGFLAKYHGTGENIVSLNSPSSTLTTKDRLSLVQAICSTYSSNGKPERNVGSIDGQLGAITTNSHQYLSTAFVFEFRGGGKGNSNDRTKGVDESMNCITASFAPMLVHAINGNFADLPIAPQGAPHILEIYDPAKPICPWTRRVGHYTVDNRIIDIFYRMLTVEELGRAQGFPDHYFLGIPSTRAKYYIGNAVQVDMACALVGSFLPNNQVIKNQVA